MSDENPEALAREQETAIQCQPAPIEQRSLEAHVAMCDIRYKQLLDINEDLKEDLEGLTKTVDDHMTALQAQHRRILYFMLGGIGTVTLSLLAAIVTLLSQ